MIEDGEESFSKKAIALHLTGKLSKRELDNLLIKVDPTYTNAYLLHLKQIILTHHQKQITEQQESEAKEQVSFYNEPPAFVTSTHGKPAIKSSNPAVSYSPINQNHFDNYSENELFSLVKNDLQLEKRLISMDSREWTHAAQTYMSLLNAECHNANILGRLLYLSFKLFIQS